MRMTRSWDGFVTTPYWSRNGYGRDSGTVGVLTDKTANYLMNTTVANYLSVNSVHLKANYTGQVEVKLHVLITSLQNGREYPTSYRGWE
jgi:hypothetical protein